MALRKHDWRIRSGGGFWCDKPRMSSYLPVTPVEGVVWHRCMRRRVLTGPGGATADENWLWEPVEAL
jgi:hypothetical protein